MLSRRGGVVGGEKKYVAPVVVVFHIKCEFEGVDMGVGSDV